MAEDLGDPRPSDEWNELAQIAKGAAREAGLRDEEDLWEVVAKTMTHLFVRKPAPDDPRAYTAGVAKNYSLNAQRSFATRRKHESRAAAQPTPARPSPEDLLVAGELVAEVRALIAALPEQQREAVERFYLDGCDRRTVAELMNLSEHTVKTHLRRGRDALRKRATERGIEP